MTSNQLVSLLLFALLLASGQVLFKLSAQGAQALTGWRGVWSLAGVPVFWAALAMYGASTLLWIRILQTVPLSRAYPFVGLGFVLVPLAGFLLFGEPLSWRFAAGICLILAGVYLTMPAG